MFTARPTAALRGAVAAVCVAALSACSDDKDGGAGDARVFSVVEAGIDDMQAAMAAGIVTAEAITADYLARIERYDPALHATLAVNGEALERARALDAERAAGRLRGPLHGIPIALKDNIHTTHLPTTGGALAFADYTPPYAATVTRRLQDAGAIIIAKTTMTELANWIAEDMPNNYNAIRGHAYNPYDPRPDPRPGFADGRGVMDTGGSSSGAGEAVDAEKTPVAAIRRRRAGARRGISRVVALHGSQEQGGIRHTAGEGAGGILIAGDGDDPVAADPADRGLDGGEVQPCRRAED
jgi:hypothetical protein